MRKNDWNDIKHINTSISKIDASDPNNLSDVVMDERETRKRLLNQARRLGCEQEMLKIFAKYDGLQRNCTNQKEREDIGKLGAYEIYTLLDRGGKLYVDGQLVYDDEK
jgi:hypothetical protein